MRDKEQMCEDCTKPYRAGSGFQTWKCKHCKKGDSHPNTAVPLYCKECAIELNLCRRCGITLITKKKK